MYKEKLRELLKEVPEVKEQMEKLEFNSKIRYRNTDYILGINKRWFLAYTETATITFDFNYFSEKIGIEIIGLPLQERFIRMYCENKGFGFTINCQGGIIINREETIIIDNTKDLENQSVTFYKELYEALLEINK